MSKNPTFVLLSKDLWTSYRQNKKPSGDAILPLSHLSNLRSIDLFCHEQFFWPYLNSPCLQIYPISWSIPSQRQVEHVAMGWSV